jgi:hypothetical protein
MDLNLRLKSLKPSLSENSIQTYASLLRNLWKQLFIADTISRGTIAQHHKDIIAHIESTCASQPKKAKQLYSALLVFNNEDLMEPLDCFLTMKNLIHKHNEIDTMNEDKQELTEKQKKSYMAWEDIIKRREELKAEVEPLWSSENIADVYKIQDYVIACIYTMLPPRRLLDYVNMSKFPPVASSDNGIIQKNGRLFFVFNHYKTAACYGQQIVPMPECLEEVIYRWLQVNPDARLLFHRDRIKGNPIYGWPVVRGYTVKELQKRLAVIFKKPGFGVNILRHSFITDTVLKDTPFLEELKTVATQMGHSTQQQALYKKHI